MTQPSHNRKDLQIWDAIFARVPPEWRTAPPSEAMLACAAWLRDVGSESV
jgi:hypothetical protein